MSNDKQKGILVIAHGSRDSKWMDLIEQSVSLLESNVPVTIGYLELVAGKSIEDGVRRLEDGGAEEILVIPFFVCSGSTHLEEIQYALGVIDHSDLDSHLADIHPKAKIIWGKPMDSHPLIIELLADRIRKLSKTPSKESLMLVTHGNNRPKFQAMWEATLNDMSEKLQAKLGFSEVGIGTILPDTITESAQALSHDNTKEIIVAPVFLSEGYYTTKKIPAKLKGLFHAYDGKTYLPHPLIHDWLQEQVNDYCCIEKVY
ncbi:sirohydrochlorin chelatase [Salipaludibacillus sp. HK11]|uniref:sirohydrochlorin chelatase n=1 Tax=Salipaludibacillus sp. HK11 TaxID=3394320 RepID=UPI0039FC3B50